MYFRFRNPGIASKIPHVPFLQHNEINHTEKKQKKYLLRRDKEPPTLGTISYELTHKLLFCRTYCIPTFIDPLLFLVIPPQSRSVQHYYPPPMIEIPILNWRYVAGSGDTFYQASPDRANFLNFSFVEFCFGQSKCCQVIYIKFAVIPFKEPYPSYSSDNSKRQFDIMCLTHPPKCQR